MLSSIIIEFLVLPESAWSLVVTLTVVVECTPRGEVEVRHEKLCDEGVGGTCGDEHKEAERASVGWRGAVLLLREFVKPVAAASVLLLSMCCDCICSSPFSSCDNSCCFAKCCLLMKAAVVGIGGAGDADDAGEIQLLFVSSVSGAAGVTSP